MGAHALKTGYALVAGGVGVAGPRRACSGGCGSPASPRSPAGPPRDGAPVVLLLPAHDEEATVADVVRRRPGEVWRPAGASARGRRRLGRPDGGAAAAAGATVVSLRHNRGLGAAVRRGLAEAVARGAAAVAFCDADGEYEPEELERVVAPILRAGPTTWSAPASPARSAHAAHRRLGNLVLTGLLRFVARRRISDGQSGFRALSARGRRDAEIVHDYNYAQVLTLDLLAKGYRYPRSRSLPVPRRPLLRAPAALPAPGRPGGLPAELNAPASVLDDVRWRSDPGGGPRRPVEGAVRAEAVRRGPGHRQGVVGVVVHEQALAAEGQQGRLGRAHASSARGGRRSRPGRTG